MSASRGAFSLLETLMVVGALAFIGAVALPPLTRSLAVARPEFAEQAIEAAAHEAATIAARTGRIVRVEAVDMDGTWVLTWAFVQSEPQADSPEAAPGSPTPNDRTLAALPSGWAASLGQKIAPDAPLRVSSPTAPAPRSPVPLFSIQPDTTATLAPARIELVRQAKRYTLALDPLTRRARLEAIDDEPLDATASDDAARTAEDLLEEALP